MSKGRKQEEITNKSNEVNVSLFNAVTSTLAKASGSAICANAA